MSIPLALTALLSTTPAYGLQLHKEICTRMPHRSKTNVGQIYSTLDRLQRDGQIEVAGTTDDSLPLYRATARGSDRAQSWLRGEQFEPSCDWTEFLDMAFLSATLSEDAYRGCSERVRATSRRAPMTLSERASAHLVSAMTGVLDDIDESLRSGEVNVHPIDPTRPARGRRPRNSVE